MMRLHAQLGWLTFAVSVISLGTATLIWNDLYHRERLAELDERLLQHARTVAALLASTDSADAGRLDALMNAVSRETGVRMTIVSAGGTVLAETGLPKERLATMENHLLRPEVQGALKTGIGRNSHLSRILGIDMAYVAVRWGPPGRPLGVVRAALPRTRILDEERRGRNRLLLAVVGASLFAAVFATLAARRVSAPITRIQAAAREIASGRFDLKVEPAGARETQDLARDINNLARSVRDRIQAALIEEQRLKRLLNEMPDGILVVDQAGRLVLANESARLFLGLPPDVIGRTPVEAIRHAGLQMAVDRAALGRKTETVELRVTEPRIRTLSITLLPQDRDMVIVLHDMTRLRRLEEARRETAASIGHELRTPLSAVLGYVETLRLSPDLAGEDRSRFLEVIDRNARRLERMVTDLTQLSRLESAELGLKLEPLAPGELLSRAVEAVAPRAEKKNIRIEARVENDLPPLTVDRHVLETALLNLLDNAVRVSPGGSLIRAGAGRTDGGVRFEVADQGPGIPRELQDRIFERFYRIDPGRSPEEGGSGLGLAIVKHAVLRHGGHVGVESSPGRGATFYFVIPEKQA